MRRIEAPGIQYRPCHNRAYRPYAAAAFTTFPAFLAEGARLDFLNPAAAFDVPHIASPQRNKN
jgi:hypothetical protein